MNGPRSSMQILTLPSVYSRTSIVGKIAHCSLKWQCFPFSLKYQLKISRWLLKIFLFKDFIQKVSIILPPQPRTVKWPLPYFRRIPEIQFSNDDMLAVSNNRVILVLTNNVHGAIGVVFFFFS